MELCYLVHHHHRATVHFQEPLTSEFRVSGCRWTHKFLQNLTLLGHCRRSPVAGIRLCALGASANVPEQAGGKMVVELVGAFNELTGRMNLLSTSSSRLLFSALKLCIPILQALPLTPDGRSPLSRGLSVALILAHLQIEFMRNLEDRDDQYKTMMDEKVQMADNNGLIQVYRKELGDRLATS